MQKYYGLQGSKLSAATIVLVVCPAFLCYGYNQGVLGGVLTLPSFVATFPQMDTTFTTGAVEHYNSTVQGMSIVLLAFSARVLQATAKV